VTGLTRLVLVLAVTTAGCGLVRYDSGQAGDAGPDANLDPIPFYATTQNGELYEIDTVTEQATLVDSLGAASFAGQVQPGTRRLLYFAGSSMGMLRSYDLDTAQDVELGETGVLSTDDISRIDFDGNGVMWFMSNDNADLYRLDPASPSFPGAAEHIRSYLGTIGWGGDLVFGPDGSLYVGDRDGGLSVFENLGDPPVVPATPTRMMTTDGLTDGYTGLIFDPSGVLWATDFGTTVYTVDTATGVATARFDLGVAVNDLSLSR